MAILERMIDKRPQHDRILVAQLTGEAGYRARWRELSSEEEEAAVAALRELCRKAGADPEAIPGWIAEGRRRGANAGRPPFADPRPR